MEQKIIDFSHKTFVLISIIIFSLVIYLFGSLYLNFKTLPPSVTSTIDVTGKGTVPATPDVAILEIGIRSEAKDTKVVFEENTKKFNQVLKEIKNLGIEEKDIQTTGYFLFPAYSYDGKRSVLDGYSLEQRIQVKIRDFSKIGQVLERSVNLGSNLIGGVSFQVEDIEKYLSEARKLAIEDAKRKAEEISQASGVRLKRLVHINEVQPFYPYSNIYSDVSVQTEMRAIIPEIKPGEKEITVNITLTYEIKSK